MSFGKLPFNILKAHLFAAADILRGSLDANEFRQPIMTLLFLKRLNDLEGYGEKIKRLIEESIVASNTIKLIPPTKIDNKNFMKLVNYVSESNAIGKLVIQK